jgi:hypothetical protein
VRVRMRNVHSATSPRFAPVRASPPSVAMRPPRCGAFADEPRVVVGGEGGRVRARNVHSATSPRFAPVRASPPSVAMRPPRCGAFADEPRVVVGGEGGRVRARNAHSARWGRAVRAARAQMLLPPTAGCSSSPIVRVPGRRSPRELRFGNVGGGAAAASRATGPIRFARLALERIASSRRRARRHLPFRCFLL